MLLENGTSVERWMGRCQAMAMDGATDRVMDGAMDRAMDAASNEM